jgi:D-serine deaminase-like pyridoxal phosphate-dependent protein
MTEWYHIENADSIDSPALLFFPERIKENIRRVSEMLPLERLRPHVKTHKTKEIAEMQVAAGISKFKCATIAEAELLGMVKASDVLLAYQPVKAKALRLIQLINAYPETSFSCLVDNEATATMLSEVASSAEIILPVYIDLNVGMNRTGIIPELAFELYEKCNSLPGLKMMGLHAYDGHIHHPDLETRRTMYEVSYGRVQQLTERLEAKGYNPNIIAGGSPSFPFHLQNEQVESSPGTFVLWDKGYGEECAEQEFLPAAIILTRVISLPTSTRICVDLGYKSIASENPLDRRAYFISAPDLQPVGHSEEHMVLEAGEGHSWKIGDVLYAIPIHVCPTVALYESAVTVIDNQGVGEWEIIARNRKIQL